MPLLVVLQRLAQELNKVGCFGVTVSRKIPPYYLPGCRDDDTDENSRAPSSSCRRPSLLCPHPPAIAPPLFPASPPALPCFALSSQPTSPAREHADATLGLRAGANTSLRDASFIGGCIVAADKKMFESAGGCSLISLQHHKLRHQFLAE